MMKKHSAIEATLAKGKSGGPVPGAAEQTRPTESPRTDDEGFVQMVEELYALLAQGELPEGFDLERACADPAFAELMEQFPAEAAVRVYAAEKRAEEAEQSAMQRVTNQLRSRNGLPKSARGGAMASPATNYHDMDSDAFRQVLAQMKKAARDGARPRI